MARLEQPFNPADFDMPTEEALSLPVGIPHFRALTVYRCKTGYQANLAVEDNQWIVQINSDPMRAIEACFKARFG